MAKAWSLYLVCVAIFLSCCSISPFPLDTDCPAVCQCQGSTAVCGKTDVGLTKIPELPARITRFIFVNGNIPLLNRQALSPVSKCRLQSMALRLDNITRLSNDVFTDFPLLQHLDLSGNKIPAEMLKVSFQSLAKRLKSVVLRNVGIEKLPQDLFGHLKDHIRYIDLSNNNLKHVFDNDSLLEDLSQLTLLNISFNKISFFSSSNPKLKSLYINNNLLTEIPDFCLSNGSSRYSHLVKVDMERNGIKYLDNTSFSCLDSVEYLFLGYNKMRFLQNNTFRNMKKLKVLQLIHLNLTEVEELALCSMSLLELEFYNNNRVSNYTFPGGPPFKCIPKLTTLNLENTYLDTLPANSLKEMFSQLKAIKKLNLQNTKLRTLPASLSEMNTLETLILASNNLTSWSITTFANLTHLTFINLNNNGIQIINETSFPAEMRLSLKKVNLGNNDFHCTCALQWFRSWMNGVIKNDTIKFIKYPQSYWCVAPKRQRLDKYNPTYAECHKHQSNTYMFAILIVAAFLVLMVVVFVVVYRFRWHIRYLFYTRLHQRYQRLPGRYDRFIYDAFVVYCSQDADFVREKIMESLERNHHFKLCIHVRDFVLGRLVVDNITELMEKSRKVILVVSNHFATNEWCGFEVEVARRMGKPMIIVSPELNPSSNISSRLQSLRETHNWIYWEHGQDTFRDRLLREMNKDE